MFVHRLRSTSVLLLLAVAGCGGGTAMSGSDVATEGEWRALRQDRPAPLGFAPRVSVGSVEVVGTLEWPPGLVTPALGISELVVTGLLARRDVDFVERRRFSVAARVEQQGTRPPGQPAAGVSPGADYQVNAVFIRLGDTQSSVDVRLVHPASGEVAASTRQSLPANVDGVTLARGIVEGTLSALDRLGERPTGDVAPPSANDPAGSGVSPEALQYFLRGLAAEERWQWEEARRGYQAAARASTFPEAAAALARTARLRLGGTIAES